jgi:hypothetical protein
MFGDPETHRPQRESSSRNQRKALQPRLVTESLGTCGTFCRRSWFLWVVGNADAVRSLTFRMRLRRQFASLARC